MTLVHCPEVGESIAVTQAERHAQAQARPSPLGTKQCDQLTEGDSPESWVVPSHALDNPISRYRWISRRQVYTSATASLVSMRLSYRGRITLRAVTKLGFWKPEWAAKNSPRPGPSRGACVCSSSARSPLKFGVHGPQGGIAQEPPITFPILFVNVCVFALLPVSVLLFSL